MIPSLKELYRLWLRRSYQASSYARLNRRPLYTFHNCLICKDTSRNNYIHQHQLIKEVLIHIDEQYIHHEVQKYFRKSPRFQ
jgi:hypothetical protein